MCYLSIPFFWVFMSIVINSCQSHFHHTALNPPRPVQLVDIQNGQVIIQWTHVDSCAPVSYNITSNCTTCSPTSTNLTTTSCSISEPTTDVFVCAFSVQSVVCDNNLMGGSSTSVVTLQGRYLILDAA